MASSYSAVAVAAKVLIWVAMGAGFYLVPEVSRRRAEGEDPRPILGSGAGDRRRLRGPGAAHLRRSRPHLLIKARLRRSKTAAAANSLLVLGLAFTVLACTYLAIQYMLALRRTWFLVAVAAVAIAEPILLLNASQSPRASPPSCWRSRRRSAPGLRVRAATGALAARRLPAHRSGWPRSACPSPSDQTAAAARRPRAAAREARQ